MSDSQSQDTRQWLRSCKLLVGKSGGEGIDLSKLRIRFQVTRDSVSTPNVASIKVYNVSETTAQKMRAEYTDVYLEAGYPGNSARIFQGSIIRSLRGNYVSGNLGPEQAPVFLAERRESPVDTFVEIIAQDGDVAYNFATIHVTLAAGSGVGDQLRAIETALKPYNVSLGKFPAFLTGGHILPRGQVLHGQVRDILDNFCASTSPGTTWSIQDGVVEIVPVNSYLQGNAIVISPATGLIGMPRQSIRGVEFTALLNPNIRAGRAVQIDGKLIQQVAPPTGYAQLDQVFPLQAQGFYKVLWFEHVGDTRGNEWYTNVAAIAIDQAGPSPGSNDVQYFAPS